MKLLLQVTPRAYRAGEHLTIDAQLEAGTCARCPGKWRVLSRGEAPSLGMLRQFLLQLEPLDGVARAQAKNQEL